MTTGKRPPPTTTTRTAVKAAKVGQHSRDDTTLILIQRYQQELLDDKAHANHIIKLYQYTTLSPDTDTNLQHILASTSALSFVFNTYRKQGDFDAGSSDTDAVSKYKLWLHKQHSKFISQLYTLLHTVTHEQLQCTVIELLCADVSAQARKNAVVVQQKHDVLYTLLQHVLLTHNLHSSSLTQLTTYIQSYTDIRYYTLQHISALVNLTAKQWRTVADKLNINADDISSVRLTVSQNACQILSSYLPIKSSQYETKPMACSKQIVASTITDDTYRSQLSDTWLAYLCNDNIIHNRSTYIHTLSIMHATILPSVTSPLLLCDYLTDSYNVGGVTSILALHGLFDLIHKHNLDYPHFYTMLYKLCGDTTIYHSSHRATFFKLLHAFLTTSYLPNYMVASFVKRLARIALTTSAPSTYYILALLHSILQRQKAIRPMLYGKAGNSNDVTDLLQQHHQQVQQQKMYDVKPKPAQAVAPVVSSDSEYDSDEEELQPVPNEVSNLPAVDLDAIIAQASAGGKPSKADSTAESNATVLPPQQLLQLKGGHDGGDPFDAVVDDPQQTNALYSSLWEVATLSNHYIASIATLAKSLIDDQTSKIAIDIDDYIDCTYTQLYDVASKYKQSQKSHLSYNKPSKLFQNDAGVFADIFT